MKIRFSITVLVIIGIFFSPSIVYAQEIETTTIDLDTLWEIAKTKDATVLPIDQQMELMKILEKDNNFLNDIKEPDKLVML